jgi:cytochrome bd ubiquinol oxidase subunit I
MLAAALPQVAQQYLFEARQMQALSLGVHIPLVCFGISFPSLVLFSEWRYRRTGDLVYLTLARRWSKVMITLFAVGVVTGTILSFELGLLWPNFMATYGSVFGLGFGLEGFSFFLEAIFIGIYVYGWDRLSPRNHLLSGIPIIVAGITGSLFVISVNAWMNHPTGFRVEAGKVVDVHPWQALFGNTYFLHEFVHMYLAGYIVTGFLVAGVYASAFLRGRAGRYHRTALGVALAAAVLASLIQPIVGDWAARDVGDHQPVKLAAIEGLAHTTRGAPEHLLGWYEADGEIKYGIRIPRLLSLLAKHDPNATIQGLEIVPPRDRPPVNVVRLSFQAMVGIGLFLAALSTVYLVVLVRRGRPPEWRWFHGAVIAAGPLALTALIAGWITTEVGRQPWIVYGLMRTSAAVTGARGIPLAYGTLVAVYACLAVAVVWVLRRIARSPLDAAVGAESPPALRPAGAAGAR